MYKTLDPEKIIQTIETLAGNIDARFPHSGLGRVCQDLLTAARESQTRSAWISSW